MKGSIKRSLSIVIFVALFLLVRWLGLHEAITLEKIQWYARDAQQVAMHHYTLVVCCYLGLFIIATVLFLPVTVVLTIVSGFLFGMWFGLLYSIVGATIGSVIIFLLVRYVLGGVIQRRYAAPLAALNNELNQYGYLYLLMLQFFPATPTPMINLCAGLTKIPLKTFVWTTAVGILPGSLVYTIVGQELLVIKSVHDLMTWPVMLGMVILSVLAVLPIVVKKVIDRKK